MRLLLASFLVACSLWAVAQPLPCGANPQMTSTCASACVICDIDGFTGINDLTAPGQPFNGFCTTEYNNMQYIAFVAGSTNLTIQVVVGTCLGGINSLEVGFFESSDCENFTPITFCDTDIQSNTSVVFESQSPLTIGQYYYLVIDGSNGANCSWTFNVLAGTTEISPLTTSGNIDHPLEACPNDEVKFKTVTGEEGATTFLWTLDGLIQNSASDSLSLTFPNEGEYEVCVIAANVCDQAPPSCSTIKIYTPGTLIVEEVLCEGDCVEYNGKQFCESGFFEEKIALPIGCDSTILIDIEVLDQPITFIDLWICNTDSFFIGNNPYNQTGTYSDIVLTVNNCDSIVNLDLLVIVCEIEGSTDHIPAICKGTPSGTLLFSIDQGEPPLTYTYTNIEDASITGTGSTDILVNNEISGIPAGTYQIYVADNFGNDVVLLQEVTEPSFLQIELVPSDYGGFNVSCLSNNGEPGNDGTLEALVSGGVAPYFFNWSDGQQEPIASGLTPAFYSLTVTDAVGCTAEINYTLTAPPAILPVVEFIDPSCDGFESGSIEILAVEGGTPDYIYSLDGMVFLNQSTFTNLTEGNYEVYIQDENGCIVSVQGELTAPQIPVIQFPNDLTINLADSIILMPEVNQIDIQDISWSPLDDLSCGDCLNPWASPVNNQFYNIIITSVDNCTDSATIHITVDKRRRVFIPNVFSPNGDGLNEGVTIYGGPEVASIIRFNIYDRWGNLIHEGLDFLPNDVSQGWDGRFKNQKLNPGLFVFLAEVLFIDGVTLTYTGDISLLK